ncbi:MAG: DUF3343 domain-containing protein [Deltaproteobacteria bacterium]|nr:DUF3343 domain-containing protein [Deltaproteobacteria bacterium]
MSDVQLVILFPTSAHVMRAEKLLKRADIRCKLIPVPRHLSSDCGSCLLIDADADEAALKVLDKGRVEFDKVQAYD